MVHTVTLKQVKSTKKNKKIAAAVYLYQVDNDGEWGEIRFDFATGTAEIVRLAEWDTIKSNVFAKTAIRYIRSIPITKHLDLIRLTTHSSPAEDSQSVRRFPSC